MDRKHKLLLWIILICSLLCGCTSDENTAKDFYYNCMSSYMASVDKNYFYILSSKNGKMISIQGLKEYSFIRDPFAQTEGHMYYTNSLFIDGGYIYYTRISEDDGGRYEIVKRNSKTLEEKVIYKKRYYKERQDLFLGLIQTYSSPKEVLNF